MDKALFDQLVAGIRAGDIVPYLGPGALLGCRAEDTGEPVPADSDSLILAMNNGRPMAPKLMYEFPRAAMNVELKRGRGAVDRFLTHLYSKRRWTSAPLHQWLRSLNPRYMVDINRDLQAQAQLMGTAHNLIVGVARIGGSDYRFRLFHYDGENYTEIEQEALDFDLPCLFKPLGSPEPLQNFIASDADFVDYITELMGGFAIPGPLKSYRKGKQYLFIGMRFRRDTERMVMSDVTYGADSPRGWALIPDPNAKEQRYCQRQNIELLPFDVGDLLDAAGVDYVAAEPEPKSVAGGNARR